MIFNATVNGYNLSFEAENKRQAFLKALEAFSSSAATEEKMYYLSQMSNTEFEEMLAKHKFITLEETDA